LKNATSSGGVLLVDHLMADYGFEFFDGLGEFGVFFLKWVVIKCV
jgi:hypothetical protein